MVLVPVHLHLHVLAEEGQEAGAGAGAGAGAFAALRVDVERCGVPSPAPFLCQQLDPSIFLEARQGLGQEPQSEAKGAWAGSNVSDTLRPPTLNQKSSSKSTRSSFSHQPAIFAADEPTVRPVFNPLTLTGPN
ncbi:hypothetical protein MAC_03216 [Metarhizium acridum CQMa 102]|uniref:Uncharacterized protein n=1 Tax=Metarhizium acridum (strain CQMa 102) TaxID=655827 RepID=E9E018_METAQ|nr:uncharacterized protein MAC_03216 [Metarhizium acridum CQMa 102]EFY90853.1 hypothetical protein MAC_03216 [Metarhizium acridum CQMa 102]